MSLLVVGLSHRTSPVQVLERAVIGADDLAKLQHELVSQPHVDEVLLLSTCNRVEVLADVTKFHGGVQDVSEVLARGSGIPLDILSPHLYVHYEDRAVEHVFAVAAGLDSMVVGEAQILGQLRAAYRAAREQGTLARSVGDLVSQALRTGKRVHTETGIDRAGQSLVSVGLDLGATAIGGYAGRSAVLVGAGSMGALTGASLRRLGVADLTVLSRTPEHAAALATRLSARSGGLSDLVDAVAAADVLVSCTGATGTVVGADELRRAMQQRRRRPLYVLDLALPHDVEPDAAAVDGVTLTDLAALAATVGDGGDGREIAAARAIVAEEVAGFLGGQRSTRVAPTVVALRSKAAAVVETELLRLAGRLPDLDAHARAEVATTVHRVVDKLLHAPTVRVKELATAPGGDSYAAALRELFELDPSTPEAVTRAAVTLEDDVTLEDGVTLEDSGEDLA